MCVHVVNRIRTLEPEPVHYPCQFYVNMHPVLICFTLIAAAVVTNGARHPFWNQAQPYAESDEIQPVLPFQPVQNPAPQDASQPPQTFHSAPLGCTCPTTRQFNPVCGTDGNTYRNREIMSCYIRCGATRTSVRYSGTCRPGR